MVAAIRELTLCQVFNCHMPSIMLGAGASWMNKSHLFPQGASDLVDSISWIGQLGLSLKPFVRFFVYINSGLPQSYGIRGLKLVGQGRVLGKSLSGKELDIACGFFSF